MSFFYVPVKQSALPEYLSSGFVGVFASKEPDPDVQSEVFPDVYATRGPVYISGHALLEIAIDSSQAEDVAPGGLPDEPADQIDIDVVSGPIPISRVERILFTDAESLADFEAVYGMMPDMPLDLVQLATLTPLPEAPHKEAKLSSLPSTRKRKIRGDVNEIAATLVGIKEACHLLNASLNKQLNFKLRYPTGEKLALAAIDATLALTGFAAATPDTSKFLLGLYFRAVAAARSQHTAESVKIVTAMQDLLDSEAQESDISDQYLRVARAVLEKTVNISMGLDSFEELSDSPNLCLQRAISVACIATDIDSIDKIERNVVVGKAVKAIATILVSCRLTLSRMPGELWREDKRQFSALLEATTAIATRPSISVETIEGSYRSDFSKEERVSASGFLVSTRSVQAPPHLRSILASLEICGFTPMAGEDGDIEFLHREHEGDEQLRLHARLKAGPLREGRENLEISAAVPDGGKALGRKGQRASIMATASKYMVSLSCKAEAPDDLLICRYQLLETMDQEEVHYCIDLLAHAHRELVSQLNRK